MSSASSSLAGTWGLEKLNEGAPAKDIHLRNTTVYREQFSTQKIERFREEAANRFTKFKALQDNNVMIMKYSDNAENGGLRNDLRLPFQSVPQKSNTTSSGNFGEQAGGSYGMSSLLMCTSNDSLPTSRLKMNRTHSRIMSSADTPIAVGRSGHRVEKGVCTYGVFIKYLL